MPSKDDKIDVYHAKQRKLKADLKELDRLREDGTISEARYTKLKAKYEKKMDKTLEKIRDLRHKAGRA